MVLEGEEGNPCLHERVQLVTGAVVRACVPVRAHDLCRCSVLAAVQCRAQEQRVVRGGRVFVPETHVVDRQIVVLLGTIDPARQERTAFGRIGVLFLQLWPRVTRD